MKITKVDIYMLDAGAQRASRRPICCRIWTDEGIYGDGEAGIAFDYAAPAGVGMLQDLSRLIIGLDPMRVDAIWEKLSVFPCMNCWEVNSAIMYAAMQANCSSAGMTA